jgi:hypothetical protein
MLWQIVTIRPIVCKLQRVSEAEYPCRHQRIGYFGLLRPVFGPGED